MKLFFNADCDRNDNKHRFLFSSSVLFALLLCVSSCSFITNLDDLSEGTSQTQPGEGGNTGNTCGDNAVSTDENCDDGNTDNGDSCDPTCKYNNSTSLFAGTPSVTGSEDGLPTNGQLGNVAYLTNDATKIYIADVGNNLIREIEPTTGNISTIEGKLLTSETAVFSNLGHVVSDGSQKLFFVDGFQIKSMVTIVPHIVRTVAGTGDQGSTDGNATESATFDIIGGIIYYQNYLYIVDSGNATLRRLDLENNQVATLAGDPNTKEILDEIGTAARFIYPTSMTFDGNDLLYIVDNYGISIRTFSISTHEVKTIAGNSSCGYVENSGQDSSFYNISEIAFDGSNLYVSSEANTLQQILLPTLKVSTMIGHVPANCSTCPCEDVLTGYIEGDGSSVQMNNPKGILYHSGLEVLFFSDSGNSVIRKLN